MPISPHQSREYNLLLNLVSQVDLPAGEVRNILWLLNSHEHLIGFPTVFDRLHYILNKLQVHTNVRLADYGIDNWPHIPRSQTRLLVTPADSVNSQINRFIN